MATVAVRFVFPAVSAEGAAFWIIRTAPVSYRDFLWSKFWIGLVPVVVLSEGLTITANHFLGVAPFLKILTAAAILVIAVALVGLAAGLGARYPRFNADNASQVAGSPGGVAYMIAAVCYIIIMIVLLAWPSSIYLMQTARHKAMSASQLLFLSSCLVGTLVLSVWICLSQMRSGIRALDDLAN
jgi:ABC-2 type transport system permease protein